MNFKIKILQRLTFIFEKDYCIRQIFMAFVSLWSFFFFFSSPLPFVHPHFGSYLSNFFLGLHSILFFHFLFSCSPSYSFPLSYFFLLSSSSFPLCDGSFSWRCCSTASICPACCANPPPHQALGPSTHTKYFYLFIQFHGLPGGNLRGK